MVKRKRQKHLFNQGHCFRIIIIEVEPRYIGE